MHTGALLGPKAPIMTPDAWTVLSCNVEGSCVSEQTRRHKLGLFAQVHKGLQM